MGRRTLEIQTVSETPGSLYANDIEGNREEIKRLETNETVETLGVLLSPDGNNTQQVEHMRTLIYPLP